MRPVNLLVLTLGAVQATASLTREEDLIARTEAATGFDDLIALNTIESRDLVDDIWDAIKGAASCAGCQSALGLLKGLAALGDRVFSRTIVEVCKAADVEDDDVCEGAIGLQAPVIRRALQEIRLGTKPAELFCITILGLCPFPKTSMFEPEFPTSLPENDTAPEPSGRDPIKVVHYADIHIDANYVEGSNTDCSKPICCRPFTSEDSPGQTDNPAGPFGHRNCNTPQKLEESMYDAIKELVPDVAFAIFTGDMIDNGVWTTSQSYNEGIIRDSFNRQSEHFDLIYAAVGNHEMHPTNVIAPSHIDDSAQWMYDVFASGISDSVGSDAADHLREAGFYSVKYPEGNLRIITINTNFYYTNNYYMYEREMDSDPEGQIAWLVDELDKAESAGENVWIVGHQALGDKSTFRDPSASIDRVLNRYSASIRAMFFGHTHSDHFQITYSDYDERTADNARIMSYINPSLTPSGGRNPAFRVYDVDPETFAILDATVYYADMHADSFNSDSGPEWKKYYSAKEAYGPLVDPSPSESDELSASFWHDVTVAFENDNDAFKSYMVRKGRGYNGNHVNCDEACKEEELCSLRGAKAEHNCYVPEPGLNFRRLKTRNMDKVREMKEQDSEEVARAAIASLGTKKEILELLSQRVAEENAKRRARRS